MEHLTNNIDKLLKEAEAEKLELINIITTNLVSIINIEF